MKLETASKKSEYDYCAEHFPKLKGKLLSLNERLAGIIPTEEDHSIKEAGDANYLKTHVAKALTAADDFDGDAGIEAMSNLLAYDFGDATNALLESAMAAFKSFNYDEAAEKLKSI